MTLLTSVEICAGAGGQAIGLERAGFMHVALVENDASACQTLRINRPDWNVLEEDVRLFAPTGLGPVDLLAGGVPCPPFSVAGRRLGADDERDLFPEILRLTKELKPRAVMIENVRGLLDPVFDDYRKRLATAFRRLGYRLEFRLYNASDFGTPQLRPRVVGVALPPALFKHFAWPEPTIAEPKTVGDALKALMAEGGWDGADAWAAKADRVAPTLVGGSKKHGGPDLGPTRARNAWAQLGVNATTLAEDPPAPGFEGAPRLTVRMAAVVQGFPSDWQFYGRKTAAYRQVGNAFPPQVAEAVGNAIKRVLELADDDSASVA